MTVSESDAYIGALERQLGRGSEPVKLGRIVDQIISAARVPDLGLEPALLNGLNPHERKVH